MTRAHAGVLLLRNPVVPRDSKERYASPRAFATRVQSPRCQCERNQRDVKFLLNRAAIKTVPRRESLYVVLCSPLPSERTFYFCQYFFFLSSIFFSSFFMYVNTRIILQESSENCPRYKADVLYVNSGSLKRVFLMFFSESEVR